MFHHRCNLIGGVMVSVLASSLVDCWVKPKTMQLVFAVVMVSVLASSVVDRLGQTKDYNISICCFSADPDHATLRLVGSDSVFRAERHIYPRTIVPVI